MCPGENRDPADKAPFGHWREELEAVLLPHPVASGEVPVAHTFSKGFSASKMSPSNLSK